MSWLKIDDGFVENPKVLDLSDRAFRLHMAGLCYCARNLTDGVLVGRSVKVVCAMTGALRKHIVELRDAGLWVTGGDGFEIKDYLEYNPDAATVKDLRDVRREAGKRGGVKSGETRRKGKANEATAEAKASSKRPSKRSSKKASPRVEPRPVPVVDQVLLDDLEPERVEIGPEGTAPVFQIPKDLLKDVA